MWYRSGVGVEYLVGDDFVGEDAAMKRCSPCAGVSGRQASD
jgi:hypothetical protein